MLHRGCRKPQARAAALEQGSRSACPGAHKPGQPGPACASATQAAGAPQARLEGRHLHRQRHVAHVLLQQAHARPGGDGSVPGSRVHNYWAGPAGRPLAPAQSASGPQQGSECAYTGVSSSS